MRNAYKRANKRSTQTSLVYSYLITCLLKVDKIALSTFLTSVNVAQKVKKFKTLTSVKKNLGSLTKKFRKTARIFPS